MNIFDYLGEENLEVFRIQNIYIPVGDELHTYFILLHCIRFRREENHTYIHTRDKMPENRMITTSVDPEQEERLYLEEVAAVKKWWGDERWRYTKRPFTAEQIVAKRGNLTIEYPSNVQSKKLWKILEGRFEVCCLLFFILLFR